MRLLQIFQEGIIAQHATQLIQRMMTAIERHEPVVKRMEEREALHLGEAIEIDVTALLLHLDHLLDALLKALHRLLFLLWI